MDTKTGLWYHGYEFDGQGGGHNFANALWGRGNCWVGEQRCSAGKRLNSSEATMAIPMFLQLVNLPRSDPVYRSLTAALIRQVDALLERQDPQTGLWHTVLDDPTSYPETSCAAGFVAGILMGVRHVSLLSRARWTFCT